MSGWDVPQALQTLQNHFLEQVLDDEKFRAFYMRERPNSRMLSTLFIFCPEGIIICGDLTPALHGNCSCLGYGLDWFASHLSEDYLCSKFLQKDWHRELAEEELRSMASDVKKGRYDRDGFAKEVYNAWELWAGILDDVKSARKDLKHLLDLAATTPPAASQEEVDRAQVEVTQRRAELNKVKLELRKARSELADQLSDLARDVDNGNMGHESFYHAYQDITGQSYVEGLPGYGYHPRERIWLCALQKKFSELYHKRLEPHPTNL